MGARSRQLFLKLLGVSNRPILWLVTLMHFLFGLALVLVPDRVVGTTALAPFRTAAVAAWGLAFLGSALGAFMALVHEWRDNPVNRLTFWAFIPQQTLLMVAAASVIYYVSLGHYADGTEVPGASWFIAVDQLVYILLAAFHPFGILRMHAGILPVKVADHVGE